MKSKKLLQINEGEYYLFFNFYRGNKNINFGFPYKNSTINNVFLGKNGKEQGRISFQDAHKYLSESLNTILSKHKFINQKQTNSIKQLKGKMNCKICHKQLRGNLSKVICTKCFNNLGRPEINNLENFHKLNSSYIETFKLVVDNKTLEEISTYRDLTLTTIINHLEKLSEFVDFKNYKKLKPNLTILKKLNFIIDSIGRDHLLKEFYEEINALSDQEITYDDIKHCLFYIDYCS